MTSFGDAVFRTSCAASAMPGGSEPMGESGRAHSASEPVRFQETSAKKSGVATRAAMHHLRKQSTSSAKISDSAAATIAKRAIGRKSASTDVRNVKYTAGSHASATMSQPGARRRTVRAEPQTAKKPSSGVAMQQTASGQ